MMDIQINAKVLDVDGQACGHISYVVLNPVTETITHLVVKRTIWPNDERLVPIRMVTESAPDHVCLSCSKNQLAVMDTFIETQFIESDVEHIMGDPYVLEWPYRFTEHRRIPVEHERIPINELAVRRGARVEATDGYAGHVDGFLVDETSEHITHLVLREGHLWGQKDVIVPVSDIAHIEEDTVHLKVAKDSIENLPVVQ